jgi:hypothetical protein
MIIYLAPIRDNKQKGRKEKNNTKGGHQRRHPSSYFNTNIKRGEKREGGRREA